MARISEQTIEQIRSTADILEVVSAYVQLKKRGRNYFGLCPFHGEKTASFSVSPERQIYKCFGCGAGGGAINFIMELEKLEFVDAVKHLADQYGIELDIDTKPGQSRDLITQLMNLHEQAAGIYLRNLGNDEGREVLAHLEERGLSRGTIKQFKLGYSMNKGDSLLSQVRQAGFSAEALKECGLFLDTERGYMDRFRGRIMFSIPNASGKIAAFAGRVFKGDDPAKYVNSPETPIYNKSKILYGLHMSKATIRDEKNVIVVEGYLDFLQLYQAGIKNIVAVSGTAFTEQHALQLKRFCNEVHLAYDGDKAGIAAAIRAGYVLLKAGVNPHIVPIPEGLDPDDWVKDQGTEPFLDAVKNSEKLLSFHHRHYQGDLSTPSGTAAFVNDVLMEMSQIKDPIIRELNAKELGDRTGISPESIFQSLSGILEKQNRRQQFHQEQKPTMENGSDKIQLVEEELIRLCFSREFAVRNFLYENVNPDWITAAGLRHIFDKLYIHLHSTEAPEAGLILDELKEDAHRRKLTDLVFDLEKVEAGLEMARDCVSRLEKNLLNSQLFYLREELKTCESAGNDPMPVMKKISEIQERKNNIGANYTSHAND